MKTPVSLAVLAATVAKVTSTKVCQDYTLPLTVTSENFIHSSQIWEQFWHLGLRLKHRQQNSAPRLQSLFRSSQADRNLHNLQHFLHPPRWKSKEQRYVIMLLMGRILIESELQFSSGIWVALLMRWSYLNSGIQPEKHSFVDYTISQGYSIFFYDRLGVGKSSVYMKQWSCLFLVVADRAAVSLDTSISFQSRSRSQGRLLISSRPARSQVLLGSRKT